MTYPRDSILRCRPLDGVSPRVLLLRATRSFHRLSDHCVVGKSSMDSYPTRSLAAIVMLSYYVNKMLSHATYILISDWVSKGRALIWSTRTRIIKDIVFLIAEPARRPNQTIAKPRVAARAASAEGTVGGRIISLLQRFAKRDALAKWWAKLWARLMCVVYYIWSILLP